MVALVLTTGVLAITIVGLIRVKVAEFESFSIVRSVFLGMYILL